MATAKADYAAAIIAAKDEVQIAESSEGAGTARTMAARIDLADAMAADGYFEHALAEYELVTRHRSQHSVAFAELSAQALVGTGWLKLTLGAGADAFKLADDAIEESHRLCRACREGASALLLKASAADRLDGRRSDVPQLLDASLAEAIEAYGATSVAIVPYYLAQARFYRNSGNITSSLAALEGARGTLTGAVGRDNLEWIDFEQEDASVEFQARRLEETERALRNELALLEIHVGVNSPRLVTTLEQLAELARQRQDDPEPYLNRALSLVQPEGDLERVRLLEALAGLYASRLQWQKANDVTRDAIRIVDSSDGQPLVLLGLQVLDGRTLEKLGRWSDSEAAYRRAISTANAEKSGPTTLIGIEYPLARTLAAQGKDLEFAAVYSDALKSLSVLEFTVPADLPPFVTTMVSQAQFIVQMESMSAETGLLRLAKGLLCDDGVIEYYTLRLRAAAGSFEASHEADLHQEFAEFLRDIGRPEEARMELVKAERLKKGG